jgi:hypothetical protein
MKYIIDTDILIYFLKNKFFFLFDHSCGIGSGNHLHQGVVKHIVQRTNACSNGNYCKVIDNPFSLRDSVLYIDY